MPREFSRTKRVAENIKRVLAPMVNDAARELDIGIASITEVDVAPDLSKSSVYISLYCAADKRPSAMLEFNERASQARHLLAKALHMRKVPTIQFHIDRSMENSERINRLLDDNNV